MSNIGAAPTYRSGSQSVAASGASAPEERAAALAFLQELAAEVSEGTVDLPCFPHVVTRISAVIRNFHDSKPHTSVAISLTERISVWCQ